MKKESKLILGQWRCNRLYFTDAEKKLIIEDYLGGNETKQSVFYKYTGYHVYNGTLNRWMLKFGIADKFEESINFVNMPVRNKEKELISDDFETLQLKKRIEELEKQLHTAEMKAIAFSTMVDIAEKEFNIPIRKKHNTKL